MIRIVASVYRPGDGERVRAFYESLGYSWVRTGSVAFDDVTLDLGLYYRCL